MIPLRALLYFGICVAANLAHAQSVKSSGKNSPAVGIVKGDMIVNNILHNTHQKINNYAVSVTAPDTSKLNVLEQHQDALLIATNPTQVELVGAQFMRWVNDKEEYLTLNFINSSKLPAVKFDFGIIDSNLTKTNIPDVRFLKINESGSSSKNLQMDYQLEPGKTHLTPYISVSELNHLLKLSPSDCIVWAGVETSEKISPDLPYTEGTHTSTTYSFPVAFTYKSIFNQYYLIRTGISLIVTQRDALVSTGSRDRSREIRCHDIPD